MFDLSATWGIGERTTLRMGMDNIFDEEPVITGARTASRPEPDDGSRHDGSGFYSILGRQIYVGIDAQF